MSRAISRSAARSIAASTDASIAWVAGSGFVVGIAGVLQRSGMGQRRRQFPAGRAVDGAGRL